MTTIILTAGTSWAVPGDWSATNTIGTLAAGGGGAGGGTANPSAGSGGGGGAYSEVTNTAGLSGSITIAIGAFGAGSGAGSGTDGGDTYFNGASLGASTVGAKGGKGGVRAGAGGLGGEQVGNTGGVGTTKNKGGTGGATAAGNGGAGGGGSAGNVGDGKTGGAGSAGSGAGGGGGSNGGTSSAGTAGSGASGGAGGNGTSGAGGGTAGNPAGAGTVGGGGGGASAGAGAASNGGAGGNDTTFDATHGAGGGGGGGAADNSNVANGAGGNAGTYGGGGGGAAGGGGGAAAASGGNGGAGLIYIVYTPVATVTLVGNKNDPALVGRRRAPVIEAQRAITPPSAVFVRGFEVPARARRRLPDIGQGVFAPVLSRRAFASFDLGAKRKVGLDAIGVIRAPVAATFGFAFSAEVARSRHAEIVAAIPLPSIETKIYFVGAPITEGAAFRRARFVDNSSFAFQAFPAIEPEPVYTPHGGGFGGGYGWSGTASWSGGAIKPLRKPGEEFEIDPEDIRELLLDAFGRKKKKKPGLVEAPQEIPPHILALAAQMAKELGRLDHEQMLRAIEAEEDEEEIEMLLLGSL